MHNTTIELVRLCGVSLTWALGAACSGNHRSTQSPRRDGRQDDTSTHAEDPTLSELRRQELESERKEFIAKTREELVELDREANELEAEMGAASDHVDRSGLAEWDHQLFEISQEHTRLEGELARAEKADLEQWKQVRGRLGVTMDSIQAAFQKVRADESRVFDRNDPGTPSRLCSVRVPADVEMSVDEEDEAVVLSMTTEDAQVTELQRQAMDFAESTSEVPGASRTSDGEASSSIEGEMIAVQVTAANTEHGANLRFETASTDMKALRERIEQDAEQYENGACGRSSKVTMRR